MVIYGKGCGVPVQPDAAEIKETGNLWSSYKGK